MTENEALHPEGSEIRFEVDLKVFPQIAVSKTAYWYTKDYHVQLRTVATESLEVTLKLKEGAKGVSSAREVFLNRLLDQSLREELGQKTEALRNLILAHALSKRSLVSK